MQNASFINETAPSSSAKSGGRVSRGRCVSKFTLFFIVLITILASSVHAQSVPVLQTESNIQASLPAADFIACNQIISYFLLPDLEGAENSVCSMILSQTTSTSPMTSSSVSSSSTSTSTSSLPTSASPPPSTETGSLPQGFA
jgi:hypothetical protein